MVSDLIWGLIPVIPVAVFIICLTLIDDYFDD